MDRLLPAPRRRSYAPYLLSHVAPFHTWGIPRAARPRGWRVFFKGGWRPDGSGQLVHQAALLERAPRRIAIAVLTDGSPRRDTDRRRSAASGSACWAERRGPERWCRSSRSADRRFYAESRKSYCLLSA